jgi:carboxylesterase type B
MQPFADGISDFPYSVSKILEDLHIGMEPMGEDCLYLNVFTPYPLNSSTSPPSVNDTSLLPVMVWFHGGSNIGGSGELQSNIPFYDGKIMCASEPHAVIVTVNYRLGVFGFLSHDELLSTEGTAGNMGIQDQRFALHWVQANAAAFGGDKTRVTIFGESAGAGAVGTHLISALSAPLFSAGIMQSGGLWLDSYVSSAAQSKKIILQSGCDTTQNKTVLGCLRDLPAEMLLKSQIDAGWPRVSPCADGYEFPFNTTERQLMRSGNFTPKPMLVGTNVNESAIFFCGSSIWKSIRDENSFRVAVAEAFDCDVKSNTVDKLASLYNASSYDDSWQKAFVDIRTDKDFYCDSRFVLDHVAAQGEAAFQYLLAHTPTLLTLDKCFGVPHTSDLLLLWGNVDLFESQEGLDLGKRMRLYWKNFVTDPTVNPGTSFPAYGGDTKREYMVLQTPTDATNDQWHKDQCDFLDSVLDATHLN